MEGLNRQDPGFNTQLGGRFFGFGFTGDNYGICPPGVIRKTFFGRFDLLLAYGDDVPEAPGSLPILNTAEKANEIGIPFLRRAAGTGFPGIGTDHRFLQAVFTIAAISVILWP